MSLIDRYTQKHLGKALKQYEKGVPSLRESVEFDPVGHAKIDVRLPEPLFEPMNANRGRELNRELFAYLDWRNSTIPSLYQINLTLHGHLAETDRSLVADLIKQHYDQQLLMKQDVYRFTFIKAVFLALLGLLIIAIAHFFRVQEKNLLGTILSTVASFSLWESADALILQRRSVRQEMLDIAQYSLCHISFKDD